MTSILYSDKPYNLDRTKEINSWTDFREQAFTYNFDRFKLSQRPLDILEVGSFEGASACWFMENIHCESDLWLVDEYFNDAFYYNIDLAHNEEHAYHPLLFEGKSQEILKGFVEEGQKFDLIYVDASHEYEDVKLDLEYSHKLLRPLGYLVVDDYYESAWPGVVLAADEFIKDNPDYVIADKGYGLWLQLL